MNSEQRNIWKNEVLDTIFEALAASPELRDVLIFKGARVLNRRLANGGRQSLDLDTNLSSGFADQIPGREEQARYLERHFKVTLTRYFERQSPVRYSIQGLRVRLKPPREHPRGWNALEVAISLADKANPQVLGMPRITIDVAAPEQLLPTSTAPLRIGEHDVVAYSVERMAGEKLRAFLSSLPTYRKKIPRRDGARRVKDIYDFARICHHHPPDDLEFWRRAGRDFHKACESRFVDCVGIASFGESQAVTRDAYDKDPTIPKDISFDDAWGLLESVVSLFEREQIVPFTFAVESVAPEL